MKVKDKLLITFDNIWRRKLIFTINVLLGIIAIVLFGMVLHMYNKTTYVNKEVNRITQLDKNNIYISSINTINFEENKGLATKIEGFYDALKEHENVDFSGTYSMDVLILNNKIDGLGKIFLDYGPLSDNYMGNTYVDKFKDFSINRISVNIEELRFTGVKINNNISSLRVTNDYIEVLVGCKLKDYFKIGQMYTYNELDGEKTIKVVGYLEENAIFYKENILDSPPVYSDLDGFIVFPEQYKYMNDSLEIDYQTPILFYSDDSDIANKVKSLASQFNISISLDSLNDLMNQSLKENENYQNIKILTIVIFLLTIIAYTTSGIVSLLTQKNEIGIFYSCGFSTRNVVSIVTMENIIQLIIVYFVGAIVIYKKFIAENIYIKKTLQMETDIFLKYDITTIFVVLLTILVVISVIPIVILKHMSINSMLKDN